MKDTRPRQERQVATDDSDIFPARDRIDADQAVRAHIDELLLDLDDRRYLRGRYATAKSQIDDLRNGLSEALFRITELEEMVRILLAREGDYFDGEGHR